MPRAARVMTAAGWPAVVLLAAAGLGALGGLSATLRLVVTVATDDGDGVCDARCTLRDAIAAANAAPGRDTIVFAIGGGGPRVLRVTAPLPAVTSPVRLDATTQPGWAGRPIVALDGAAAGPATIGLDLAGAGTVVRGLAVHSFSRAGLRIRGERTVVAASAVGTDWRAEPLGNRSLFDGSTSPATERYRP